VRGLALLLWFSSLLLYPLPAACGGNGAVSAAQAIADSGLVTPAVATEPRKAAGRAGAPLEITREAIATRLPDAAPKKAERK
jgi:hypothetical protein